MSSRDINPVLLRISDRLSSDELDKMKFLCQKDIGKKDQEKISTGSKLFQFLMERGKLSADNTERVSRMLRDIHRPDLADLLDSLDGESGDSRPQPDEAERGRRKEEDTGGRLVVILKTLELSLVTVIQYNVKKMI